MPLSADAERELKLGKLGAALRDAGIPELPIAWHAAPSRFGYRNRVRLCVVPGVGASFFNPHKLPSCAVLEPLLLERVRAVCDFSRAHPQLFADFSSLEVRADDARGRPGLALKPALASLSPLQSFASIAVSASEIGAALADFDVGVCGDPQIALQQRALAAECFGLFPLDGFLQVNSAVNALLIERICQGAASRGVETALDLFAGAGNFSLPLARSGVALTAVELHAPAVRGLGQAASCQALTCRAIAGSALEGCEALARRGERFELVLFDAPRAGAKAALGAGARLATRYLVVCSCLTQSFARELGALTALGYRVRELEAFDMFPCTEHLELLAWLEPP